VDDDVEPAPEAVALEPVEPVAPDAVEPEPVEPDADDPLPEPEPAPEPEPELMLLLLPPMRAFFRTKPPAPPDDALLVSLLLDVELLDPSARCRQPVAVTLPAASDAERPVPCPPCGVLDVGACAASAPHSATLLLSVIAHCQ
jgi:hypothetical protein